jgi:hypothetical protein
MHEHVHDPYKTPHKLPEPTICPECGAVFQDGRWQWVTTPLANAHSTRCQACHRVKDNYPAGLITLSGPFVPAHKVELIHLARNCEASETRQHPLDRIMKIEDHAESIVISTTDLHLPHRIGDVLVHAYQGEIEFDYDDEGYFARVNWRRDL